MNYKELDELYEGIKEVEKKHNDVNYISRLHILDNLKQEKEFEALADETKRQLIESIYYYWVQSIYPIESSEDMARIIFSEKDSSFALKLRNNSITVKEIADVIARNSSILDETMYC